MFIGIRLPALGLLSVTWLVVVLAIAGFLLLHQSSAMAGGCDVTLEQNDFDSGTFIIDTPGTYCLAEDISFNPNNAEYLRTTLGDPDITAYEASFPLPSQLGMGPGQYDPGAFALGFFTVIAVASPDVVIDLKGHTLEQSKEHALLQRFFSVIETSDRPFISGQGPNDFGTIVGAAENLTIKNGKIGRSAHHGIHGNRAKNVTIRDIDFKGFEVAAVAMNGVKGLTLQDLTATSRKDVPVLGQFSTAQFIKPYVNFLVTDNSTTELNGAIAATIQAALKTAINNVHEDLIIDGRKTIDKKQHPAEWALFHNEEGVVDGNSYGYLINGVGVAVNGFPTSAGTVDPSTDVTIENVSVNGLKANIREIVALVNDGSGSPHVRGPVGSIFQVLAEDPNGLPLALSTTSPASAGVYVGNAVTDAQALVAKAAQNGDFPLFLDTSRNTINADVIAWVESPVPLSTYLGSAPGPHGTGYLCNGDQMFHVNKGVIGFKLDGTNNINLKGASAKRITNVGAAGSTLCGAYETSHPGATLPGYGGAVVRGMSISGSTEVMIEDFKAKHLRSENGSAIGIDILTDSENVSLKDVSIKKVTAANSPSTVPTAPPEAIGFRVGVGAIGVSLADYCAKNLKAFNDMEEVLQDLSDIATATDRCR